MLSCPGDGRRQRRLYRRRSVRGRLHGHRVGLCVLFNETQGLVCPEIEEERVNGMGKGRTLRMDSKSSCIYGLISFNNLSGFIHKNEIRDADLRKVLREWIEPEMICEDWITDRAVGFINISPSLIISKN